MALFILCDWDWGDSKINIKRYNIILLRPLLKVSMYNSKIKLNSLRGELCKSSVYLKNLEKFYFEFSPSEFWDSAHVVDVSYQSSKSDDSISQAPFQMHSDVMKQNGN